MDAGLGVSLDAAAAAASPPSSGASRRGYRRCQDLRKTARGASSPAKPALHMPELIDSQFCLSFSILFSSVGAERTWRAAPRAISRGGLSVVAPPTSRR